MTKISLRNLLETAWHKRASDWWRFALSLTRNVADAEDLVDDAVARTLQADPTFQSEPEVHKYILTAIRNNWISRIGRRETRRALYRRLRALSPSSTPSPLQALIDSEAENLLKGIVDEALEKMNPKIRQAVELYLLKGSGMTFREVAEIQGVSTTTAHARVHEALRILSDELVGEVDR